MFYVRRCLLCFIIVFGLSTIAFSYDNPLPVPFKPQVPPGEWDNTNNCGQTSALMVMCYHNETPPTEEGIKGIDDCLFQKYGDPINNYNGSVTNTTKLEALVKGHGGFTESYKDSGWSLSDLRQQIDEGRPVIAAVTASYLSRDYNYAGGHFVVIIGYTDTHIVCNDPGTSLGAEKHYLNSEFSEAFSSQGGSVVVVLFAQPDHNAKWHPNGTLVKIEGNSSIYLLENGKKRHISSAEIFEAHKFKWSDVITISQEELNAYPSGPDIEEIKTDDPNNGKLLRAENDYRVYWVQNGVKRHILCPEILEYHDWKSEDVLVVESWQVAKYPNGPAVGNGLLVKKTDDPTVYVIENGKKRGFTTPTAFEKLGYSWCNIIDVSAESFNAIDLGWPISDELIDSNDNIEILATYKDWLGASTSGHYIDPNHTELGVQCDYEKGKTARQKAGESYLRIPAPELAASQAALSDSEMKLSVSEKVKLFVEDVGDRTIYWFNQGWQNLKGALHFKGSQLKLQAFNPDGTLYNEWQTSQPPLLVDLSTLPTGTIKFKVSPVDVPTCNYPFALTLGTPSNVGGNPWPMSGHDAQHTGRSQYSGPETASLEWTIGVGDMYNPPLIGTDGTIYITEYEYASITDHIRAYNPDGSLKWVFNPEDISSEYKGADFESCPVIGSDGTFYIAAGYPGGMYAINPDGTLKWNKPGKGNLTIGPNDTIYCGGSTGVYAFDSNGDQKWFYETAVAEQATAVGLDGTVYAGKTNSGQGDGRLIAIDSNGSFKWEYTVGVTPLTPPIVGSDGTIYIGTYWYLYAVSPDGTLKWKYDTGGHDYKFASPAIGPDGTIYIGINGGLVAIDPTGTLKWEYDLPSLSSTFRPNTLSIDKEGIIYVGTRDSLIAINSDGTLKWEYEDSYSHFIYPVIGGEGRLYVGMKLSFLWAFDSSLLEDAIEQLPENVEVASKYYDIIPQSQSKVYSFNLDSKKNLGAVVNWSGNELLLRVFRPDETLYGEYEISSPPFTFTIPGAESGIWQFEISSTDILNGDYPFALVTGTFTPIPGDVDRDGNVNLTDAILAIRICAGITPSVSICPEADVNGDGKIGLAEVVYILQKVSGLRQ